MTIELKESFNAEAILTSDLIAMIGFIDSFNLSKKLRSKIESAYASDGNITEKTYQKLNARLIKLEETARKGNHTDYEIYDVLNKIAEDYLKAKRASLAYTEISTSFENTYKSIFKNI